MSQENVEIVRCAVDAFNRDGPEAALAWLAPDLEWHDLPDLPDAEIYRGHRGFLKAFEQFFGDLELYRVNVDEIIDHGEQMVVCARNIGQGRGSGARFEQRIFGVWTVRNRLIARAVWFRTRAEALKAMGLEEWATSQENVEVVQAAYAAWNGGDMDAFRELVEARRVGPSRALSWVERRSCAGASNCARVASRLFGGD